MSCGGWDRNPCRTATSDSPARPGCCGIDSGVKFDDAADQFLAAECLLQGVDQQSAFFAGNVAGGEIPHPAIGTKTRLQRMA